MSLKSQIGIAPESTYGTREAPTRFVEFLSESLTRENLTLASDGIRGAGRALRRGSRRTLTGRQAAGQISMEVGPDDVGILFEHALGAADTTTPGGATNARQHVFRLGDLIGKSLTVQVGRGADDGSVIPFDYVGCKIVGWTLSINAQEILQLQLDIDARDEVTGETLGVASLSDGIVFSFTQGVLRKDGSPLAQVGNFQVQGTNPLKTDKMYLGNGGVKSEPTENGIPTVTGQAQATFIDLASFHTAFAADSPVSLELEFTGGEIEAGINESLKIELPDVRFNGATPTVDGPEVPEVTIPFEAYEPAAGGEAITVTLVNEDLTP